MAGPGELDFQLDGFPWAQENVSNDLGRSRCDGPSDLFVFFSVLFSYDSLIHILEDFVEAELAEPL